MTCEVCRGITPVDGFGGFLHYASARDSLEALVREGLFESRQPNPFERLFRCRRCQTVWVLAAPDFPVRGYLLRKEKA